MDEQISIELLRQADFKPQRFFKGTDDTLFPMHGGQNRALSRERIVCCRRHLEVPFTLLAFERAGIGAVDKPALALRSFGGERLMDNGRETVGG